MAQCVGSSIPVFREILLVLEEFLFREGGGGWGLGDNSIGFWDFSDITLFSGILSLKSFGNLRGNSYISSANY